jgi:hypothetical protein
MMARRVRLPPALAAALTLALLLVLQPRPGSAQPAGGSGWNSNARSRSSSYSSSYSSYSSSRRRSSYSYSSYYDDDDDDSWSGRRRRSSYRESEPRRMCNSPNCYWCGNDGVCTSCNSGYVLNTHSAQCTPCSWGCARCTGGQPSECSACTWLFTPWWPDSPEGCSFDWNMLMAILVVLGTTVWRASKILPAAHPSLPARRDPAAAFRGLTRTLSGERTGRRLLTQAEHIARSSRTEPPGSVAYPSGRWAGYYTYEGSQFSVAEFDLQFTPAGGGGDASRGRIVGSGVDNIGHYAIDGRYGNGRVAFSKHYEAGSQNTDGRVIRGNKGHTVEYRGEMAGPTLGSGTRGTWHIRRFDGDFDGIYHLWPAMDGWTDEAQAAEADESPSFEVEGECVVCMEGEIDTKVLPCGHVAMCSACVRRLPTPKRCPLCRADVRSTRNVTLQKHSEPQPESQPESEPEPAKKSTAQKTQKDRAAGQTAGKVAAKETSKKKQKKAKKNESTAVNASPAGAAGVVSEGDPPIAAEIGGGAPAGRYHAPVEPQLMLSRSQKPREEVID